MGKKNKRAKTKAEATAYKHQIKALSGYSTTGVGEPFNSLQGSNDDFGDSPLYMPKQPLVGAKRLKLKKFFQQYWFETLISVIMTIVIGIAAWTLTNVIELREKVVLFEYRITIAENKLNDISIDAITKDYLKGELEILKLRLDNTNKEKLTEIETEIKLIEKQLEYLEKHNSTDKD